MNNELIKYLDGVKTDIENCDDLYEYFDDVLDVEYAADSRKRYLGAKIYITLGGPNIWIDTRKKCICGAWGCNDAELPLASDVAYEIDDIFEAYYEL
jgi:hypothetical protein